MSGARLSSSGWKRRSLDLAAATSRTFARRCAICCESMDACVLDQDEPQVADQACSTAYLWFSATTDKSALKKLFSKQTLQKKLHCATILGGAELYQKIHTIRTDVEFMKMNHQTGHQSKFG